MGFWDIYFESLIQDPISTKAQTVTDSPRVMSGRYVSDGPQPFLTLHKPTSAVVLF